MDTEALAGAARRKLQAMPILTITVSAGAPGPGKGKPKPEHGEGCECEECGGEEGEEEE